MTANNAHNAALKPLTKKQIKSLVLLAWKAYGMEFPPPDIDFDEWRHRQCMITVERAGLTDCRNEDYLPLRAHFQALLGNEEQAAADWMKHEEEPRSWAMHKLDWECRAAAEVMPEAKRYAAGFVRNKRNVELSEADDKTLWHAMYVVRRRAQQLRKQQAIERRVR